MEIGGDDRNSTSCTEENEISNHNIVNTKNDHGKNGEQHLTQKDKNQNQCNNATACATKALKSTSIIVNKQSHVPPTNTKINFVETDYVKMGNVSICL